MTREEAIRTLKEHKIMFQHDFGWDTSTLKALDMAINSLEVDEQYQLEYEKIEPCEDCISRKAILDKTITVVFPDGGLMAVVKVSDIEKISSVESEE